MFSPADVHTPLVLVVEDDLAIARFLCASLNAAGYATLSCERLLDAKQTFEEKKPNMVVLDLGLPDGDGKDFLLWLRRLSDVPVMVLSARQDEAEKVGCLDAGADDYLSKPFGAHELLARVRVALRRSARTLSREHLYDLDGLHIDLGRAVITLHGQAIHLTPIEFKLISQLASMPGRVFTHRQLLTSVWGEEYVNDTHYLRIHMGRLRAKLERLPAQPRFILTEAGAGYRLAGA
jgi:two-component system KDP operon response regulator KdpE